MNEPFSQSLSVHPKQYVQCADTTHNLNRPFNCLYSLLLCFWERVNSQEGQVFASQSAPLIIMIIEHFSSTSWEVGLGKGSAIKFPIKRSVTDILDAA